jgi:Ni/Fe-hydrogenase subunit HybB-like protein
VESRLSSRAFGRSLEMPLLMDVGRALAVALGVAGGVRLYDLARRGALGDALAPTREAAFFQLEFALGVLIPVLLLALPQVRRNARRLYAAALLAVVGFVVNRLNVSITGFEGAQGAHYVPALPEYLVTVMMVAIAFALFGLAVRFLPVYPREEEAPAPALGPALAARM